MALPCLWGRSPSHKGSAVPARAFAMFVRALPNLRGRSPSCKGVRRLDTWDIEKTRSVSFRFPIGSVLGNRTPDSAVRGLRLNLLTNTPYSLIIYAVRRKIYYTEEPPSCPVLFLFFSKLFLRGLFLRVNCKSNFTELNACEPRAGRFGKSGRAAGTVRARLPARPLISVSGREPCTENSEIGGPGAGTVRAQLPAKPLMSVSGREPRAARFGNGSRWPADLLPVPR